MIEELRAQLADRYRIERELSGGAMSRVFVAEELALGRPVVIKVLPPDLGSGVSAARFEREVRVAARLQHPHIVPLLSAGSAGGALFYTMPFVEGESLRALLARSGELPVQDAVRILRDVADALAYAHREGIVHRDIKPDNILLSHRHAMVTDFGVARALAEAGGAADRTGTGIAVGTPAYMAPEQGVGESQLDARADLYALGVVAYEMLAGEAPFRAANFQALVAAHLTQDAAPLRAMRPAVSEALARSVHRCLEKRAADRYQSATDLMADLDRLPLGPGAPPTAAASAGISRRQALLGGAAAGLIGLTLGRGSTLLGAPAVGNDVQFQRLTFRRGMIRSARFAPDQRTVIYGALWDGDVCRAYMVRPESPESSALGFAPALPLALSASGELALAMGDHLRGIMSYGTLARVPMAGGAPRELAEAVRFADWTADGRELAVVRLVDGEERIEFPLGTLRATPAVRGGGFSFLRVSPRGDAVAAIELSSRNALFGHVVVVDRSGAVTRSKIQYFNIFGLAWRGDEIWFTAAESLPLFRNTVYAMRPGDDARVVTRLPTNTSLHDIATDGRVLIARTDDRGGSTVRTPGSDAERDFSWLDAATVRDLAPDGSRILFEEAGVGGGPKSSVYLRGTDGTPAVRLSDGYATALSPDGRWALVRQVSGSDGLQLVPTGAGDASTIEAPGLQLRHARWLADSRRIVVRAFTAARSPARLYLLDTHGGAPTPITPEGLDIESDGWAVAPDGSAVAVRTPEGPTLFPLDGTAPRRLPGEWAGWTVVGWITGGVLLCERPENAGRVLRVDPASGRAAPWADIRPQDPSGVMTLDLTSLVTTPDGRAYAYSWHRAISDLYLVDGWH